MKDFHVRVRPSQLSLQGKNSQIFLSLWGHYQHTDMRSILMMDLCSTVTLEPLCITLKLKVHNVGGHVIATQSVEIDHVTITT